MEQPAILIADDTLSHLRLMEIMLASEGYALAAFDDAIDVLAHLKQHTPDLIILDIDMPRMTGLELCARIKGVVRLQQVPVILVTALKDPRVVTDGRLVHADAVLQKPLGIEWFRHTIKRYLPERTEPVRDGRGQATETRSDLPILGRAGAGTRRF